MKSGVISCLIVEALENILEEFITIGITTITTKAISFIFVFLGVQITKITAKGIWLIVKSFIKKITYKEGTDKMEKIKEFFKSIKLNPKTTIGAIASFIASLSAGGFSTVMITNNTGLPTWSSYVIGGAIFVIVFVLTELGVFGKGKESEIQIALREIATLFGWEKAYDAVFAAKEVFDTAEQERIAAEEEQKAKEEQMRLEAEQIAQEVETAEKLKKEQEELKEQEEQKKAIKEKAIQKKAEYDKAVSEGYTGSFSDWLFNNK